MNEVVSDEQDQPDTLDDTDHHDGDHLDAAVDEDKGPFHIFGLPLTLTPTAKAVVMVVVVTAVVGLLLYKLLSGLRRHDRVKEEKRKSKLKKQH